MWFLQLENRVISEQETSDYMLNGEFLPLDFKKCTPKQKVVLLFIYLFISQISLVDAGIINQISNKDRS